MSAAAGPGQPNVNIASPTGAQVPCSLTPTPDGAAANFVPTEAGPHNVQVTFADQRVPGSPFTTVATQVQHSSQITVSTASTCLTYILVLEMQLCHQPALVLC